MVAARSLGTNLLRASIRPTHSYFCDGRTFVRVGLLQPTYLLWHRRQSRQDRTRGVGSTRRSGKELAPLDEKSTERPHKRVAYRPREVAEMVGMSESGIRNLIRRGTLRAVRLDGRWLIPATAIEDKLGVQLDANIAVDATADAAQTPA